MHNLDAIEVAGRVLHPLADRVRRYCGLTWAGGPPETWAFAYYDQVPSPDPDRISPVDVVTCSALHPGLNRTDLEWFAQQSHDLNDHLERLPANVDLADAPPDVVSAVESLELFVRPVGLSLLSKVAHRKRPRLIPLLDRTIIDRYWARTAERGERAWHRLIPEIRLDLRSDSNREAIAKLQAELRPELGDATPTQLRILDIAVWMEGAT